MKNLRITRMAITVFVVLVAMLAGACADSPTAPKERVTVAVASTYSGVGLGTEAPFDLAIRSMVVGRGSINDADGLIVRTDGLIDSITKIYQKDTTGGTYIDNTWKPTVTHHETWRIWTGAKSGTSWFVFKSRMDQTQKDSVMIVIWSNYGTKG